MASWFCFVLVHWHSNTSLISSVICLGLSLWWEASYMYQDVFHSFLFGTKVWNFLGGTVGVKKIVTNGNKRGRGVQKMQIFGDVIPEWPLRWQSFETSFFRYRLRLALWVSKHFCRNNSFKADFVNLLDGINKFFQRITGILSKQCLSETKALLHFKRDLKEPCKIQWTFYIKLEIFFGEYVGQNKY